MCLGLVPRKLNVVWSEATGVPGWGKTETGFLYAALAECGAAVASRTIAERHRPKIRPIRESIDPFFAGGSPLLTVVTAVNPTGCGLSLNFGFVAPYRHFAGRRRRRVPDVSG